MEKKFCLIMCPSNSPSLIGKYYLSKKMQFKNEVILDFFSIAKSERENNYNCQNPIFDFQCEAKKTISKLC